MHEVELFVLHEAFERRIGAGGVVRDAELHRQVVTDIEQCCQSLGLEVRGLKESSLLGPKGNREFFIYAVKTDQ